MARSPTLEDAILEEPTDLARYVVYGDWLLAQGDPHGELVSVQAALASTKDTQRFLELKGTEKRLLAAVTASLVPAGAEQLTLSWRYGEAIRSLKVIIHEGELSHGLVRQLRKTVKGLALGNVEVFGDEEEAGVHTMDPDEAKAYREREERLATLGDYNRDDWN